MTAKRLHRREVSGDAGILRESIREAPRYLVASALALAVDAGAYVTLIRVADMHYMIAAPIGYALGIALIYTFSTVWVFHNRRLENSASEFLIFTLIGVAGLLLNQIVIYSCVEALSASYEAAKLASAALVFGINYSARKLILFTRF